MPHMNNVNFSENKFVLLFLRTTENIFGDRKEHKMKEWSIPNEYTWVKVFRIIPEFWILRLTSKC